MNSAAMVTRSSLELMLESILRSHEQPKDIPPALPLRPASKGRLPRPRRCSISSARVGDGNFGQDVKVGDEEKENARVLRVNENTWFGSEFGVLGAKRFNPEPSEENTGDVGAVLRKVSVSKERSKMTQRSILVIQKCFRGYRARCYHRELKNGVNTLQSFVLGENVRRKYQLLIRRHKAIIIIQKHVKNWIAQTALKNRDRAITRIQSVVRGWISRKHFSHMVNLEKQWIEKEAAKPEQKFSEVKEFSWVRSSVLVEFQIRVMMAEKALENKEDEKAILQQQLLQSEKRWSVHEAEMKAKEETWQKALEKKEDENAVLQQQLLQSEKRWSEYEAKMKAMEETWQKQLASLQMSLSDKKDIDVGPGSATPVQHHHRKLEDIGTHAFNGGSPFEYSRLTPDFGPALKSNGGSRVVACLTREFEQHARVFDDDVGILVKVESEQIGPAPRNSIDELRKLKLRFDAWNKNYKNRLRGTKTMLQRVCGRSGTGKSRKKWWGKSAKGMLGL